MKNNIPDLTSPYYTRQNLELVLGSKRRTVDYRIAKFIDDGVLAPIKPGFYLNKQLLSQAKNKQAFLEYVGCVVKYPAYVSLSYALSQYELIPESVYTITYITSKKTGQYSSTVVNYSYRSIKQELFTGYEKRQFQQNQYLFASKAKALFDFIYLAPLTDSQSYPELLFNSRINWSNLLPSEQKQFIAFCLDSGSKKMQKVVQTLKEENKLWSC